MRKYKPNSRVRVHRDRLENARLATVNRQTGEPFTQLAVCLEAGFGDDTQYQRALGNKRNFGVRYETLSRLVGALQQLGKFSPPLDLQDFISIHAPTTREVIEGAPNSPTEQSPDSSESLRSGTDDAARLACNFDTTLRSIDFYITLSRASLTKIPARLVVDAVHIEWSDAIKTGGELTCDLVPFANCVLRSFLGHTIGVTSDVHDFQLSGALRTKRSALSRESLAVLNTIFGEDSSGCCRLCHLFTQSVESHYFTATLSETRVPSDWIRVHARQADDEPYCCLTYKEMAGLYDSIDANTGTLVCAPSVDGKLTPLELINWHLAATMPSEGDRNSWRNEDRIVESVKSLNAKDVETAFALILQPNQSNPGTLRARTMIGLRCLAACKEASDSIIKLMAQTYADYLRTEAHYIYPDEAFTSTTDHPSWAMDYDPAPDRCKESSYIRRILGRAFGRIFEAELLSIYDADREIRWAIGCAICEKQDGFLFCFEEAQFSHSLAIANHSNAQMERERLIFEVLRDCMHSPPDICTRSHEVLATTRRLIKLACDEPRMRHLALWTIVWLVGARGRYHRIVELEKDDQQALRELVFDSRTHSDTIGYIGLLLAMPSKVKSWHTISELLQSGKFPQRDLELPTRCCDKPLVDALLHRLSSPDIPIHAAWELCLALGRMQGNRTLIGLV